MTTAHRYKAGGKTHQRRLSEANVRSITAATLRLCHLHRLLPHRNLLPRFMKL